jgi:hypothetical protein
LSTPEERSLRARIAAHSLHAQRDPRETTQKARATFLNRFDREVDPTGVLSPEERKRRAEHARKAHFAKLALKSAQARRKKANKAIKGQERPRKEATSGEVQR